MIFYKIEDEKRMIKDINRYKRMGMKSFSYHPIGGGWEINFNIASIPLRTWWEEENGKGVIK